MFRQTPGHREWIWFRTGGPVTEEAPGDGCRLPEIQRDISQTTGNGLPITPPVRASKGESHVERKGRYLAAATVAFACLAAFGQSAPGDNGNAVANAAVSGRRRAVRTGDPLFVNPPADLDQVAVIVPRGNVNAVAGGHVRPVNHMYLEYPTPRDGGSASLDVDAMAGGTIVMIFHRQTEACVVPDHSAPSGCGTGPGTTAMIDEYQLFTQHTASVSSNYDHLHSLDPALGLPDWRDDHAGWIRAGGLNILILGANGALAPVSVHPGQRMGATRNYFTTWDIGVVDTRHTGNLLGTGVLRYPTMPQFLAALAASGVTLDPLAPDQPFPGEMFVNSACFTDYLTPPLATAWRAKLAGDGSCGRPDWDVAGTLRGNWYRADVTDPTLENMFTAEANAISFSPYNYDPANQTQIGFGSSFLDRLPPSAIPAAVAAARERLVRELRFVTDHTSGTRHNPDPVSVFTGGHACYDVPDQQGGPGHPLPSDSVVMYLPIVDGQAHLRLRYFAAPCADKLASYDAHPELLDEPAAAWWGDYVR